MKTKALLIPLFILITLIFSGCTTVSTRVRIHNEIQKELNQQNFEQAIKILQSNKNRIYAEKDRVLYYLDMGILYHYAGEYSKSNEYLTTAEFEIEELYTKSISRAASSFLLNDNVLEYSGEDYEDIYINILKAINFLKLNRFDSAFVEIRRINDKLNFLEDKYKRMAEEYSQVEEAEIEIKSAENKFHNSALGRYLSMIIYLTEGNMDAARIDSDYIRQAFRQQANIYNFPKPQLPDLSRNPGNPSLNIVAFTGQAPYKRAFERRITTFKDHIVVQGNEPYEFVDTIYWPGIDRDYHFKLSLPFMRRRDSEVETIEVFINGKKHSELSLIEDVGNIAIETFEVKKPLIYLKAVSRTVIKGILAEKAKAEMSKRTGDIGGFLLRVATDVAVDISENADLRTSRYLPGKVSVGTIILPEGVYDVEIRYLNRYRSILFSENHENFQVNSRGLNFIRSFYLN